MSAREMALGQAMQEKANYQSKQSQSTGARSTSSNLHTKKWAAIRFDFSSSLDKDTALEVANRLRANFGGTWYVIDTPRGGTGRRIREFARQSRSWATGFAQRAEKPLEAFGDAGDVYVGATWQYELFEMADRSRYGILDEDSYSPEWLKDTVAFGYWAGMTGGGFAQVLEDSVRAIVTCDPRTDRRAIYEVLRSIQVLKDVFLPMGYPFVSEIIMSPGVNVIEEGGAGPESDENSGNQERPSLVNGPTSNPDERNQPRPTMRGGSWRNNSGNSSNSSNQESNGQGQQSGNTRNNYSSQGGREPRESSRDRSSGGGGGENRRPESGNENERENDNPPRDTNEDDGGGRGSRQTMRTTERADTGVYDGGVGPLGQGLRFKLTLDEPMAGGDKNQRGNDVGPRLPKKQPRDAYRQKVGDLKYFRNPENRISKTKSGADDKERPDLGDPSQGQSTARPGDDLGNDLPYRLNRGAVMQVNGGPPMPGVRKDIRPMPPKH
jgi:hypothetical protein